MTISPNIRLIEDLVRNADGEQLMSVSIISFDSLSHMTFRWEWHSNDIYFKSLYYSDNLRGFISTILNIWTITIAYIILVHVFRRKLPKTVAVLERIGAVILNGIKQFKFFYTQNAAK